MSAEALIPIREVCRQAGIGQTRVYELMAAGQFPKSVHLGRSVRWSEREVQQWIADRLNERALAS